MQAALSTLHLRFERINKMSTPTMLLIMAAVFTLSFMVTHHLLNRPAKYVASPKARLIEGKSIILDWDAKESDWRAAYALLKMRKSIHSDTH